MRLVSLEAICSSQMKALPKACCKQSKPSMLIPETYHFPYLWILVLLLTLLPIGGVTTVLAILHLLHPYLDRVRCHFSFNYMYR